MIEKALLKNAKKNPNKIAVISDQRKISFKDLIKGIYSYSNYLRSFKKNKILLNHKNSIDWVIYYFAIRFSGHIPILVSNYLPPKKINFILNENKIRYLICDKKIKYKNIKQLKKFDELKKLEPKKKNDFKTKGHEIIYTSGTTGSPKGVVISFKKSLIVAKMINKIVKLKSKDLELISLPLNHSDGLGRLKCFAANGHTIILNENPNNFGNFFDLLQRYKINGFFMVPSGIEILKKMSFLNFSSLRKHIRFIELGSEKISIKTLNWLRKKFNRAVIYYHYGLTEASRSAFKIIKYGKQIPKTFRASPNVDISILDSKNKICKKNEIGEIVINGKIVADGYVNSSSKTKFTKVGYKTGDLAKMISKNNFVLLGRKDQVKKINGLSVNLKEVENEINRYPNIKSNSCKFIIRSFSNTYEIKTRYNSKRKIDEKKIQKFLKNRLEYFKIPKVFEHRRT